MRARRGAAIKVALVVFQGLVFTGMAVAEGSSGPTGPGGIDPAWLQVLAKLTWPGALAAVALGFLYSKLGQAVGERLRASVVTQTSAAGVMSVVPSVLVDGIREVSQTLREVTATQRIMQDHLGDMTELVRDMQIEQRTATQQQQQVTTNLQAVQVQLAELMGRVAAGAHHGR